MRDFKQYQGYIPFNEPKEFKDYRAIGYFPYERASISVNLDDVRPPRSLFAELEAALDINDNKYVVIFQDKQNFDTTSFAIFFKDCKAKIGQWEDVKRYGGGELDPNISY